MPTRRVSQTNEQLLSAIENYLAQTEFPAEPELLYAPIGYSLAGGGKRLRPMLLMLSNGIFTDKIQHALPAAASRTIAIVMAKISIFFIALSSRPHRVYPQVVRWNEDILHLTRRRVNEITIISLYLCIFYKTNARQSVFHRPKTDIFIHP